MLETQGPSGFYALDRIRINHNVAALRVGLSSEVDLKL